MIKLYRGSEDKLRIPRKAIKTGSDLSWVWWFGIYKDGGVGWGSSGKLQAEEIG